MNAQMRLRDERGRFIPHTDESFAASFWARVDKSGQCWIWQGDKQQDGYGLVKYHGRRIGAHRIAYMLTHGPIPPGLFLDHVRARGCTGPSCVNPDHLEPVTCRVNNLRGDGPAAQNARKTHCKRGHEFTPANTIRRPKGNRECRTCSYDAKRRRRGINDRQSLDEAAGQPTSGKTPAEIRRLIEAHAATA